MIAHLGMYAVPAANEALWMQTRCALGYGPDRLTQSDDFWQIWQDPDLLFSQTCGYPFRARLHKQVQLIGTPDYGLPGCPPMKCFVDHIESWSTNEVAINWNAPFAWVVAYIDDQIRP